MEIEPYGNRMEVEHSVYGRLITKELIPLRYTFYSE
jgi:hypothetical protein